MNTFYVYDGRNETGPFTLDELKGQRLTRNTPLRKKDSDRWMPAEKLAELKPLVAPRKIRRPKDLVPAVRERAVYLKHTRPVLFYTLLLLVPLATGISVYSFRKSTPVAAPQSTPPAETSPTHTSVSAPQTASKPATKPETAKPAERDDGARTARQRWNKLITASNSNYGIGFLGGIKNLSVTVTNRSGYPLEEVVVKLTYIKANGSVWKTVPITFRAVPANDSKEQEVADVNRAKKVKVSIAKVVSRKMQLSYAEGKRGGDASDPYHKE